MEMLHHGACPVPDGTHGDRSQPEVQKGHEPHTTPSPAAALISPPSPPQEWKEDSGTCGVLQEVWACCRRALRVLSIAAHHPAAFPPVSEAEMPDWLLAARR